MSFSEKAEKQQIPKNPTQQYQNLQHKTDSLIDLSQIQEEYVFLCDEDETLLALYPQYQLQNPHAKGPTYICPKCHIVYDQSLGNMQFADIIKPIETSAPRIMFVEEQPDLMLARRLQKVRESDPEPQEAQRLRNQGATIIDERVIIG